jgi:hypothetical protein
MKSWEDKRQMKSKLYQVSHMGKHKRFGDKLQTQLNYNEFDVFHHLVLFRI